MVGTPPQDDEEILKAGIEVPQRSSMPVTYQASTIPFRMFSSSCSCVLHCAMNLMPRAQYAGEKALHYIVTKYPSTIG